MQPSSRHLIAAALRTVQGLQILLCGGKVQPSLACLAVLLVELRLFRNPFLAFNFQLFQAGQFFDVVGLEIGGSRLVSCQPGAVLFPKSLWVLRCFGLLGNLPVLEIGRNMAVPFPVFVDAGFQVFDHLECFAVLGLKFSDTLRQLGLGAYSMFGQKRQRLGQLFEVEHLGPALVTCTFACGVGRAAAPNTPVR